MMENRYNSLGSRLGLKPSPTSKSWAVMAVLSGLTLGACLELKLGEPNLEPSGSGGAVGMAGAGGVAGAEAMGSGSVSTGAVGGVGGAGGVGGMGSGGAPPGCQSPKDCPVPSNPCTTSACIAGNCTTELLPDGASTVSQFYGDCRKTVCDGKGGAYVIEDTGDVYDDAKECTLEFCEGGIAKNVPTAAGTECLAGGYCNNVGDCVACLVSNQCSVGKTCKLSTCVPTSCGNAMKDSGETDVDCGGPCTTCAIGKLCQLAVDCTSKVCTTGLCAAPSCSDGVRNGDETDRDCGGSCAQKCLPGATCAMPGNCASGVCVSGTCQAPSCTDSVQNGGEAGVDCGGVCPRPCL